jgi:hypothetical protein
VRATAGQNLDALSFERVSLSGISKPMNHLQRAGAGIAAAAAVLSIGVAAYSQEAQPPGPQGQPTAEQRQAWMQHRREAMAQRLQAILQLRPDQQAAFQAFQSAMTPQRGEHRRRDQDAGQLTTPQRLDMMAQRMARREAAFQQRAAAIRTFYAVLSPVQQKAFDSLPMMGDRDRGHGDHDGPRGFHGPRDAETQG